jgi:hypothetical protein
MSSDFSQELARFAVVGRVNKGKSSIVSTLTEDDAVRVDVSPGSTRSCQEFRLRVRGRTLFTIVDTPGFENAGAMLRWLTERETSAADRPRLVEEFVATFTGGKEFPEECLLLAPIIAGAGILYVVDASNPYRPNYEAEMEILRWTGRPRMALLNRKGSADHGPEWRRALEQYFSIVREFDAHASGIAERISLLRAFRELDVAAGEQLDEAIAMLESDWTERRSESARLVADLLVDALTMTVERPAGAAGERDSNQERWHEEFRQEMRERERRRRRDVEVIYHHNVLERQEAELIDAAITTDLFSERTLRVLGLDQWQLARAGAVGGAAVGGTLDALSGGASFLAGTLIGGVLGGISSYFGARNAANIEVVGRPIGGNVAIIGPVSDPNFAWLVFDRAVLHHAEVSGRAHAVREMLVLDSAADTAHRSGPSGTMDGPERDALGALFKQIRKAGGATDETYRQLCARLETVLETAV